MRYLLASLAVLAGAGTALAQDDGWTGFYAGLGIESLDASKEQLSDSTLEGSSVPGPLSHIAYYGAMRALASSQTDLDIFAGYGQQVGTAFIGVEADLNLGGALETTKSDPVALCADYEHCSITQREGSFDRVGQVRGLLGVIIEPSTMVFASGGVTLTEGTSRQVAFGKILGNTDLDIDEDTKLAAGLSLGAGVEYKLMDTLRVRLEGQIEKAEFHFENETQSSVVDDDYRAIMHLTSETDITLFNSLAKMSLIWQF